MGIYDEVYASPNFGYPRGRRSRNGHAIEAIGIHIGGAAWQSNYNWIMNPNSSASYNAYIKTDGRIVSFVPEDSPAWSHGKINKATWPLLKSGVNPNIYTLSVSREGSNQNTWTPKQMESMLKILVHWSDKYGIKLVRPYIFGHFEIDSVGRWYCPGKPFFDALIKNLETLKKPDTPPKDSHEWLTPPIPRIDRAVGIELNGAKTNEVGYFIRGATYIKGSFAAGIGNIAEITGHGNHIKIKTR